MVTLLTALFYLWLVITILLTAMWFLRRQEQLRDRDDDDPTTGVVDRGRVDGDSGPATATDPHSDPDPPGDEPPTDNQPPDAEPSQDAQQPVEADQTEHSPVADIDQPADIETADAEQPADESATNNAENTKNVKNTDNTENTGKARRGRKKSRKPADKPSATRVTSGSGAAADGPAAEPSSTEPNVDAPTSNGTKAVLLSDMDLPFDLAPANDRVSDTSRHTILLSTHDDAEAVGTAFADELVRRGYEIEADGLDQARAVRGDEVLSLRISPNAGTRGSGKYRRYPTAGDTDVAIEVWVGGDKPPTLAKR